MFQLIRLGDPTDGIGEGTIVVICDLDAEKASSAAAAVESHRTAVFVGDLGDPMACQAAEAFGAELNAGIRD